MVTLKRADELNRNIRLWSREGGEDLHVVFDFPVSPQPLINFILEEAGGVDPRELEARASQYVYLPMFDIFDAIEGMCSHYDITPAKCLERLGLKSLSKNARAGRPWFHLGRAYKGAWICTFCGTQLPNRDEGIMHVKAHHNKRKVLVAPGWMEFVHLDDLMKREELEGFVHDVRYFTFIYRFHFMDDDDSRDAMKRYGRSPMDYVIDREIVYPFSLRAKHLRSRMLGQNFKLDHLVKRYNLNLLDVLILLNSYSYAQFKLAESEGIRYRKKPFESTPYARMPTGLSHEETLDYLRSDKKLLRTKLIKISPSNWIEINRELFEEKVLNNETLGHEEKKYRTYLLEVPDVTLSDLVAKDHVRRKLELAINSWKKLSTLDRRERKNMGRYGRSITLLFLGPPGTGKTLSAYALAGTLDLKVMEASIPDLMNCYVGETDKNIRDIFRKAEENDALLLFDEADALVSTRGSVSHAVDRHLNAEVNVFLQELERFSGIVVLTTNLGINLDPALRRRIKLKIKYGRPDIEMRGDLWEKLIPGEVRLGKDVDLDHMAKTYDFTGGQIKNAVENAVMIAHERYRGKGKVTLEHDDLVEGADIEKEGDEKVTERETKGSDHYFQ